MLFWYHSRFNVYIGDQIEPDDKAGLGNLARYIIRARFSQEKMVYIPTEKSDDCMRRDREDFKKLFSLSQAASLSTEFNKL